MKSLMRMTLIGGAIIFALTGCNDKNTADEPAVLTTQAQKEAYAVGSSFSTYMKRSLEAQQIKVDPQLVIKGFAETYLDKSQLTGAEVEQILTDLSNRIKDENKARLEKEASESIAAGNAFRAEYAKQEGVKQTESGLLYKVINPGSDKHPTIDSTVVVHYTGKLVDGREFDSSYSRNEPATFPLFFVIKGWGEGLQLIGEGGEIQFVVPPELAYGEQSIPAAEEGKTGIPSQSTLVFDVKLINIETPSVDDLQNQINGEMLDSDILNGE